MEIFDFHLHPLYDFHAKAMGNGEFVRKLRDTGVTFCAGSPINRGLSSARAEEYGEIVKELNREAYSFHSEYPDFYTPGIHVHPDFIEISCLEVEKYADLGVRLVGELVYYLMSWQDYSSRSLYEILRVAADRGMALSIHPSVHDVTEMERLVSSLPDMDIVIAHLDGYGLYEWSIDLMKKHKNVFFDISAHGATREGMLLDAVNRVGEERLLYGSDFPGYDTLPFINAVLRSGLTDDQCEAVFYKNARRILKFDKV